MLLQLQKVAQEQALSSSTKAKPPKNIPVVKDATEGGSGLFSASILSTYLGFEELSDKTDVVEACVGTDWLSDLKAFSNLFGPGKADHIPMNLNDVLVDSDYFEQTEEDSLEGIIS
jgi:hypothetical protein